MTQTACLFLKQRWLRRISRPALLLGAALPLLFPLCAGAQQGDQPGEPQPARSSQWLVAPSPALSPEQEFESFQIDGEFRLELVACEPMIQDPVCLTFDEAGRLWVVEMRGYMPDVDGKGEDKPVGRVSILEDVDGDGRADRSTVFLDHLVLPRAVARTRNGALVAHGGQLWFAADHDGDLKADHQILVDPDYVTSGNVEHQPNGLMRGVDNWIYNAKSQFRYRYSQGAWLKEETEFRGQWGITQDNYGRLFYNVNYSQLHADIAPPNARELRPHFLANAGYNLIVATNQAVFPIRMNTGVNRGYRPGILDSSGRLRQFASACAPCVYRGDQFPPSFLGNAFVCGPGGNLVKRNLILPQPLGFSSEFAYPDREFLASTDERFRPVNLGLGPDGTLYLVDLYRGILQHKQYMTSHLRREILDRALDTPLHLGRLWRIRHTQKPRQTDRPPTLDPPELLPWLGHANGWWRDTAQRLLIESGDPSLMPDLEEMAVQHSNHLGRIHALWTWEGLMRDLPPESWRGRRAHLDRTLGDAHPQVRIAGLRVLSSVASVQPDATAEIKRRFGGMLNDPDLEVRGQAAFALARLKGDPPWSAWLDYLESSLRHALLREAFLSGLAGRELDFFRIIMDDSRWRQSSLEKQLLISQLTGVLLEEARPDQLDSLLHLAYLPASASPLSSSQAGLPAWQRESILAGLLDSPPPASRRTMVTLSREPPMAGPWSASEDAVDQRRLGQLKSMFAWPGHEPASHRPAPAPPLTLAEQTRFNAGKNLFPVACASCHGSEGGGLTPLAPPLVDSPWVLGSAERLIRILLQGLEGPIHVREIRYEPPLVLPNMPSLESLTDLQIAEVLTFLRRAWEHQASPVSVEQVQRVRASLPHPAPPLTEETLLNIK